MLRWWQSDSADTGLVASESVHLQVFTVGLWRGWQAAAAVPQMIEPFELVSSANGAPCATLLQRNVECDKTLPFQVYVTASFFTAFQPNLAFKPKQTASRLRNSSFGISMKVPLLCFIMQNINSACFSFSLAVFLPFCHFAGEGSQCTRVQCFFLPGLTWQNNYTLVPPAGSGLLLWAFTTASAVLWGQTNIPNHLRPLWRGCFLCKWRENCPFSKRLSCWVLCWQSWQVIYY